MLSHEYDCLANFGTSLRKHSRCYWEIRLTVKEQHDVLTQNSQRQKYVIKLTFCCGFWL